MYGGEGDGTMNNGFMGFNARMVSGKSLPALRGEGRERGSF
jgi:hypothetical protein